MWRVLNGLVTLVFIIILTWIRPHVSFIILHLFSVSSPTNHTFFPSSAVASSSSTPSYPLLFHLNFTGINQSLNSLIFTSGSTQIHRFSVQINN
ncbi:hypothetical protein L1987_37728 [Smallanthus sonchifolius]|uniref:Uncharacterized protein n=1 Tax=Smallanthus sonchifolius TaxID=185202 RepID=A0ACB9HGP7_9ASTR|nr:hypothetical protein L1987_37728 [Smallanthus sonchifolius]